MPNLTRLISLINEDHGKRLPFIRIKRVVLDRIKGVNHGEIASNIADEEIPYNTKSDIIGLYGQNGSGKSSLVEALHLIKGIISGFEIGSDVCKLIDVSSDDAEITVGFEYQYKDGQHADVEYSVKLSKFEKLVEQKPDEEQASDESDYEGPGLRSGYDRTRYATKRMLRIENETIRTNLYPESDKRLRLHPIVDTATEVFCKKSYECFYFGSMNEKQKNELEYIKRKSFDNSQSFVFCPELADFISKTSADSKYLDILKELQLFAIGFLNVIKTGSNGMVQMKAGLPLYLAEINEGVILSEKRPIPLDLFHLVEKAFDRINSVFSKIVPGVEIEVSGTPTKMNSGKNGMYIQILSNREGKLIPLMSESDGIIKIVSFLDVFIHTFTQGSATLVVDELDSGVFEYLLGELLSVFDKSGKGQLFFTSHNLRPLEVLNKKYIRFTTADPNNRYYKMKKVRNTQNLRDVYLREVFLGSSEVDMYSGANTSQLVKAIKMAGRAMHHE